MVAHFSLAWVHSCFPFAFASPGTVCERGIHIICPLILDALSRSLSLYIPLVPPPNSLMPQSLNMNSALTLNPGDDDDCV
uniref:Putative secreted protein n=1 Tax=Anopheles marajoara TaxID=58244 RepID=A0A2M4CBQ0_9DIPT